MNDRGMKKWRPFNAVVPNSELLNLKSAVPLPNLSIEEIEEYEELLKSSFYTHSKVRVTYVENGKIQILEDYVLSIEPIKKDIFFHSKKINFRQIIKVKN